jgi:hypothetical protein
MTERENFLRAINFDHPEWIPCDFHLSYYTWHVHREKLEEIVLRHPRLFPDYEPGVWDFDEMPNAYRAGEYYRDNWGCLWYTSVPGLEGQCMESPLADWNALETYKAPDFNTQWERGSRDWEALRRDTEERRSKGRLIDQWGGRLFDRLYFLRGFENPMIDFATDDPHLPRLIDLVLEHQLGLIDRFIEIGADVLVFTADMATQDRLMISPAKFRQYIKPMFREVFQKCKAAGVKGYLSSDGRMLEIVDDLIEIGVAMHDPQLRANTLDGIEKHYKGRMCIKLDLDRQMFPFCTEKDIWNQVETVVNRLSEPEGGLVMMVHVYDETPLKNIEALCQAIEEICLGS